MSRLKLIVILLLVCALAFAAGGTIAYFTDAKENVDVFTVGNIYITLTQTAVKADENGNLVADTESARIEGGELETPVVTNNGKLFPGQTIDKDPTIKNVGKDKAFVCAKVIIEDGSRDIHKLFGYEGYSEIDIEGLFAGGLLDEQVHVGTWNGIEDVCYNDNYAMVQVADRTNGKYEFYFFILEETKENDEIVIFEEIFVDPLFGNTEMIELSELKITVQAFAVQHFGFSDCYQAMRVAFGKHFENCK